MKAEIYGVPYPMTPNDDEVAQLLQRVEAAETALARVQKARERLLELPPSDSLDEQLRLNERTADNVQKTLDLEREHLNRARARS